MVHANKQGVFCCLVFDIFSSAVKAGVYPVEI